MSKPNASIELREVTPDDLDALFRHQQDPESNHLAKVFPRGRRDFEAHWRRIMTDPAVVARTIVLDGAVVGSINAFPVHGQTHVGYWIDRAHWGNGIATRALAALIELVDDRPLCARVATTNIASIKALERCGFVKVGEEDSPGGARYAACTESVFERR
jgi:RimJ/RimL family protein N-acetyltransferase